MIRRSARPAGGSRVAAHAAGRRGAPGLLAVLLLAGACGGPAAGPVATGTPRPTSSPEPLPDLGAGVHDVRVGGEDAMVLLPEQANGRVVVYLHGYEADSAALLNDVAFGEVAEGLVDAGYAVAASDAGGNAWGDPASVAAHADLAAAVTDLVDATDVYLVAESMGGLAGAQLVEQRRIPGLRGYAGIFPLCDLSSVYDDFAESIDAAYGSAVEGALEELSPVALGDAVPAVFWASDDDTVVDRGRNADVCAAQVVARGGSAVVVPTEGEHGDPSNFDLPALLAFFDATAR
ncbi:alpha/beta hydrolase family protein [Geodermatophilus sp. SYSU D00703]